MIVALLIVGGAQLAGCADVRRASYLPPVNPESPVAGAVAVASTQNFKRPTFASVPPKPLNIPPPEAVKTAVIDMVRCRHAYNAWAAAHPALVSGTGGFAEDLRARLDKGLAERPTPQEEAASEAEAAKLRAFAEPPPPMHSGPPPSALDATSPSLRPDAAPKPRPSRAAATTQAAATRSAPTAVAAASGAPAPSARAPTSQLQTVAAAAPSMTPLYRDPLLAHCQ
jgi:hypothetical protein